MSMSIHENLKNQVSMLVCSSNIFENKKTRIIVQKLLDSGESSSLGY